MPILKNIIFDLGGVLLNIDYNKTEKAFRDLGFGEFKEMYNQYSSDAIFTRLETGSISIDAFYEYMIHTSNNNIGLEQINEAWNRMLLDFREESLNFLLQLGKRYQLYLISNTNAIHEKAFTEIFTKQTGQPSLDNYFNKSYYSHKLGLRKPNEDIFNFVLNDAGLLAAESLFIDDSYNNINTAKKMGFETHLLLPGEKIESLPNFQENYFNSSNSI
jgi:HAD superfamily hydrolase (TIGR01509 family)